ncbi:acyl-CoA thioesterase [Salisediminibacterium halotolerans]|uniref:Acyl-CoA hydrolase n=1 Tax=Salisediminibacterium halotolerans TaxID=517425 RepID=A0A1H9UAI6_9BACI|nr:MULTISPECIES: acyl-CoA thioesterase [Salisediminibacterium]RLJ75631.1 acyl-CoA hydrolase [Actinophytocola xinjiangensis]RPE89485.1 acyl-CoA hydrolase [Salisediminibacterium halotolerans]TWG36244.1 acyl-CoA hydrolase [Salisediminibacterium halotolerans]SES06369.1 Acyl-CoA hydrolase [Salisediminibacterium haloalkalitolerans]GEL08270.1 putative acyl-CoA thioester hydrolase YkhA [Salisediminibacterium halotolerans]
MNVTPNTKTCRESKVIKTGRVFPEDTNNHNTMFGGKLMRDIDDVASISAARHCRCECVTASTDSVDFLEPIRKTDSVCLESHVTWTGRSSMEVFVKVVAEDLRTGTRRVAAHSFLTFVGLKDDGTPAEVPDVVPESDEELYLHNSAPARIQIRQERRAHSKELAKILDENKPWDN